MSFVVSSNDHGHDTLMTVTTAHVGAKSLLREIIIRGTIEIGSAFRSGVREPVPIVT